MRVVVGWQDSDRRAASTNTLSRPDKCGVFDFETETLTQESNLKGLALMNAQWVEGAMAHTVHQRVILDMYIRLRRTSRWPARRISLQRALRVRLLSSSVSFQPMWGLRRSNAEIWQRPSACGGLISGENSLSRW